MMGTLPAQTEQPLFSYRVQLERRIRVDHPLRKLKAVLDLSFVIPAVAQCYGKSGNVSVDPQIIMKMMLLLFYYNIPSERELMEQIPERLDFLWFLGYDLESNVPNHSVLSKARSRWGSQVFEQLFVRTIEQCVRAGLVDGRLLHIDSTTLKANASRNSVVETSPELVTALRQAYQKQAGKLELLEPPGQASSETKAESLERSQRLPEAPVIEPVLLDPLSIPVPSVKKSSKKKESPVNSTHISLTDPEAHLAFCKNGVTDLTYKDHRIVDDAHGVITAVQATYSTLADG